MRQIRIILGGIISLISYFGWIFILTAVGFIFFSKEVVIFGSEVVKSTITINPIFNWLMAGLVPVFFFASQYILCNNLTEYEEKINYLRDIKNHFNGFFTMVSCNYGNFLISNEY